MKHSKSQHKKLEKVSGKRQRQRRAVNNYLDVDTDVEDSRKAIEGKLLYLSDANHMARPARDLPRRRSNRYINIGSNTTMPSMPGVAHRRHQRTILAPPVDETRVRMKGGYNAYMESPRRNGLTPRTAQEEAEAVACGDSMSGGMHRQSMRDIVIQAERQQSKMTNIYGRTGHLTKSKTLNGFCEVAPPIYKCNFCGAKFNIKSLLGAHRRTHDDDFKVRSKQSRRQEASTTQITGNLCKYCDRRFDLERTLHIHQLTHCKKISPQQRRKLAYTELLHEKKAPLPNFQRSHGRTLPLSSGPSLTLDDRQMHAAKMLPTSISQPLERWR